MLSTHFKQNEAKDKAVLYLRYSSDSQTENSIEGQRRECLAFAKSKGIDVLGEYVDRAKTGMSDDRPMPLTTAGN
jgi:site-specific DNA recombinase